MQYFKTAQLYFKSLVNNFDIFAISEHSLFDAQLDIFKLTFGDTYNFHAVSASDNPPILYGKKGHSGVTLLWNLSLDDFITPLSKIESDRIVGIKCSFPGVSPFFVLSIYLPSANHLAEEFQEYFDYLWALYESLPIQGYTILMGDFTCDLGNSIGDKAPYEPNQRGLKLAEFANYFNLCPVNLLNQCSGPVYTYHSYCG